MGDLDSIFGATEDIGLTKTLDKVGWEGGREGGREGGLGDGGYWLDEDVG